MFFSYANRVSIWAVVIALMLFNSDLVAYVAVMTLPEPSCVALVAVAALRFVLPVAFLTHAVVAMYVELSVADAGVGAVAVRVPLVFLTAMPEGAALLSLCAPRTISLKPFPLVHLIVQLLFHLL